jgi:hypothetical protein
MASNWLAGATVGRRLQLVGHPRGLQKISSPSDPERNDGVVAFHYVKLPGNTDSEYLHIRRRQEPVPQNEKQRGTLK